MILRGTVSFLLLLFLAFPTISAGQDITIDWQILGRYRVAQDEIGEALGNLAILADDIKGGPISPGEKNKFMNRYPGDSAHFVVDGGHLSFRTKPTTSYKSDTARYENGFANPTKWRVLLSAQGAVPGDTCTWSNNGIALTGSGNCLGFRPDKEFGTNNNVEVVVNNNVHISTAVAPRDVLIVGMGDSFASGEGNPDVSKSNEYFFGTHGTWLDQKCHRSLFSWQSLIAARLAKEDPHTSITFISFACSGAETRHLFRSEYLGVESKVRINPGQKDSVEPQLLAVKRELCQGTWSEDTKTCTGTLRKPDLVLLSTAGNDVGFGPLIVSSILRNISENDDNNGFRPRETTTIPVNNVDVTHPVRNDGTDLKWKFTDRLERDLALVDTDLMKFSKILDNQGFGVIPVIQTNYPNPLMVDGATGQYCGDGKDLQGRTVLHLDSGFLFGILDAPSRWLGLVERKNELKAIRNDFVKPLTESVEQYAKQITGPSDTPGQHWKLVPLRKEDGEAKQVEGFRTNGYCLPEEDVSGRWFNIIQDSNKHQGDVSGAFHPNIFGHLYYVNQVYPVVKNILNSTPKK